MILRSSFGTFTPPQITAEALRESIREMSRLGYDVNELIEFFGKAIASPESWLAEPPKCFALNSFFEAYHGDKRDEQAP